MQLRQIFLMLGLVTWLPFGSLADQDLQARFEKSVKDAKSISNVEIEWLDTLWISDPAVLKYLNAKAFSRTFQYSYVASGSKYRATCKLVSGTQTNLVKLSEIAFDGKTYVTYTADSRQMTKGSKSPTGVEGESGHNPLVAPFTFLTRDSYDTPGAILRFTDFASMELTNKLIPPAGQVSDGVVEATMQALPEGKPSTKWKIVFDEAGDSFTPKAINVVDPGHQCVFVQRLLNYTNLGGYQFPTRLEWTTSAYPPTSPPTLILTDTVAVINARIPEQIPDSTFKLDNEEQSADSIWDRDRNAFIRVFPGYRMTNACAPTSGPQIYDEAADATEQVTAAIDSAKKEKKRLFLIFGTNWSGPCQELHELFQLDEGVAGELASEYVEVMIDVNNGHNKATDTRFGHPIRFGLPTIVIVSAEGERLTTLDTVKLKDGDHYSADKVVSFLKEWAQK